MFQFTKFTEVPRSEFCTIIILSMYYSKALQYVSTFCNKIHNRTLLLNVCDTDIHTA